MWPNWQEQKPFAVLIAILVVALVGFVGVKTWNEYALHDQIGVSPKTPDTFTIDGEGKVSGEPTLAQVDVGLFSEGKEVAEAQAENSRKANEIIAGMKALGVAEQDMQTSNYSIQPKYDYKDGKQTVSGYVVSQNVNVKVRDLKKVGAVLAKVGERGANQVNGVQFTIDDPTTLKQAARKKALEDAQKKAEELASALGVRIVRVTTFSESAGQLPVMPYNYRTADVVMGGPAPSPEIQTGTLDVVSRVSVTFEIR